MAPESFETRMEKARKLLAEQERQLEQLKQTLTAAASQVSRPTSRQAEHAAGARLEAAPISADPVLGSASADDVLASAPVPAGDAAEDPAREAAPEASRADAQEEARKEAPAPATQSDRALRRLQRRLAQADVAATFARADVDKSGDLSLTELQQLLGDDVDAQLVAQLFADMDENKDGKLSLEEFRNGVAQMCPSLDGQTLMNGLLAEVGAQNLLAEHLLRLVKPRMQGGQEISTEALSQHLTVKDVTTAWDGGLKSDLEQRLGEQLEKLRSSEHAALDASEHNDKFANSTFEAAFGKFDEFLEGVAGQVGLPATKLAQGIENQFCYGPDAKKEHTTSNKGGTKFTAAEEYEFVTNPDLSKTYGNGRQGTQLDVFLLAAGAQRRDGDEWLDMPLSEIEAKYGADMLDSVKTQVLRKGKEAFLSEEPLLRKLKALEEQNGMDRPHMIKVIQGLLARGTSGLKEARKRVTKALKDATEHHRVASTGGTSFAAVATALEGVVSADELDVVIELARENVMAAKLTEEEIVGMRLYTGPPYMLLNGSLRKATADRTYGNAIHAICSGLTKLSQVAGIPEGRLVWRGVSGMRLPKCFWQADANGAKGGVERSFLGRCVCVRVSSRRILPQRAGFARWQGARFVRPHLPRRTSDGHHAIMPRSSSAKSLRHHATLFERHHATLFERQKRSARFRLRFRQRAGGRAHEPRRSRRPAKGVLSVRPSLD